MKKSISLLILLGAANGIQAAPVTYQFAGKTISTMTVNNGTSTGSIPAGTAFTGTLNFDDAQTATPVAFYGGTHSTFAFTSLTLTVGSTTVSEGPGKIDLYNNVNPSNGIPVGDSFYVNTSSSVPLNGTINGAQFNYVYLALVDTTGTAFMGSALPNNLNFASFQSKFLGFNYGTLGTPWGAGNATSIHFLSSLAKSGGSPATPPAIGTTSLPNGVVGVDYNAAIAVSAPNGDAATTSVTGLPNGLSFNGTNITGIPTAVGTSNVAITVTDSVTQLSASGTLPLTINDAAISFTPSLPDGVTNAAYSATFTAATGGTGNFIYTASGLPDGLLLNSTSIAGTPTLAGAYPVTLTATDDAGFSVSAAVTLNIIDPAPVACSGTNAVESAYVARSPGYIVVNGGLNLLDHLWTTNLNADNTTFLGGLTNWYQTGLILDYTGTVDAAGCILTQLTVKPRVTIDTTALADATAGLPYSAPIAVSWGMPPYTNVIVSGLPEGLSFDGANIVGTPTAVGTFAVAVNATDSVGASASKNLSLTVVDQPIDFSPTLSNGTVGVAYSAALSASGFGPFTYAATGLPAGLMLNGNVISGTPTAAGSFAVTLTATDTAGVTATANKTLTINPASPSSSNYTVKDEAKGKITEVGSSYMKVGTKKLIWDASTVIIVNTNNGELHVVDSFVKVGMVAQWKGLRDPATNTVLTRKLEIN